MSSHRHRQKTAVKARLEKISSSLENVYVIHYSSESFYSSETGQSPRVTSIAVRDFFSGQTMSFSIHKFAELEHVPLDRIKDKYDELEKRMLEEFYKYVRERGSADWVHWNMRDINYGFAALEHRLSVLGGEPVKIDEQRKFDLSRALVTLFGRGYSKHPRIESLMAANSMTTKDFLSGEKEAAAFEEGQYIALHQSTLRKVDTLCNFMDGAIAGTLKTRATWRERHDLHDLVDTVKDHWLIVTLTLVAAIITILTFSFGFLRSAYQGMMSLL